MPNWIQAIIYIITAMILLRLGGKKAIAQMTPSEVAIFIGIGTVLVHPLKSDSSLISIYNGSLIIAGVIIVSLLQLWIPKTKRWIMGEPLLLISNGEVLNRNLRKARIPEDELKMKLRIKKVSDISNVKSATLEVSGDLGIELYPDQSFATKKDIEDIKKSLELLGNKLNAPITFYTPPSDPRKNLFNQADIVDEKDPLNGR